MKLAQGYNTVVEHFRSESRFYLTIIAATLGAYMWMQTNFVTAVNAKANYDQLRHERNEADRQALEKITAVAQQVEAVASEVKQSNTILMTHIDRYQLDQVISEIKENKGNTFTLKQFTRLNGMDSQSETRLRELEEELEDLEFKKACIINNNSVCN